MDATLAGMEPIHALGEYRKARVNHLGHAPGMFLDDLDVANDSDWLS